MAGRRPATRRTASVEPRQTRRSTRRIGLSAEPEPRHQAEIPPRGLSRERARKSVESESSADDAGSDRERASQAPVSESIDTENGPESPDTKAARLQDLLDFDIPKFSRWVGKMYDILASIDNSRPSADEQSRLNSIGTSYKVARRVFTDDNALFIDYNLSKNYDPEVRPTIQSAVCSGNIVSLLASILDMEYANLDALPILEQLDKAFPSLFDPNPQVVPDDTDRTMDLAFLIRWRRLVDSLAADSTAKPYVLAAKIFCDQPGGSVQKARQGFDEGRYRQLAGINIDQDIGFHEKYQARIQHELLSKLSSGNRLEIRSSLDQAYPQEQLLHGLRSWCFELFQRYTSTSRRISKPADQSEQTNVDPGKEATDSLFVDHGDNASDDSDPDSDAGLEEYEQLPSQGINQNFIDGSAALAAVRQIEKKTSERLATTPPSNQQASKGKEKEQEFATIDAIRRLKPGQVLNNPLRRESARSLSEGTRSPVPISQPHVTANQAAARKRSRPDDASDDDEDFELNEQPADESRRFRYDSAVVRKPSPKRRRSSRQPSVGKSRGRHYTPGEDDLQLKDIIALSQNARTNRRAHNSIKEEQYRRPRQVRKEWSAADTNRLLDLIADPNINCSWSAMEGAGGFESHRGQQSLRDKARSMKVWYLQGDIPLPAGFDQVALGRKEKDAVKDAGRNPDREEMDIDDNGEVTNNIWTGLDE
ncbi:hypothetical protein F4779DRAFT_426690 [Xylariaceae sp. FL0662B]|nr:hypothetical protein F4779DRAFT_426690 [Xylariaceae sp. FL0662B]